MIACKVSSFPGFGSYNSLNYKAKMAGRNELNPINPVWRPSTSQASSHGESSSRSVSNDRTFAEVTEAKTKLTMVAREKHSVSVNVGASLIRFIKGIRGATQKKVEEEMGVTLVFPSSRNEDSIIIEGVSADSVAKASAMIQSIIDQAVKSPSLEYSHFISLPLAIHPELVEKLFMFQNSILDGESSKSSTSTDTGIEKSIFINPKTFHLTVLMLKLWNQERVDKAAQILQSISSQVIDALDNRPIAIRLRGLACMRGSIAKAYVVYAPVEEIGDEGRLMRACQIIIDAFVEAGLVMEKDANHKLKLHATVMNVRYRKRVWGRRGTEYIDARPIFEQYGSEDWGAYVIREAHLSQRFAYDNNGYYRCIGSMPFP